MIIDTPYDPAFTTSLGVMDISKMDIGRDMKASIESLKKHLNGDIDETDPNAGAILRKLRAWHEEDWLNGEDLSTVRE